MLQGEAVPGQHRQVVHALDGRLDVEQRALRRRPADQLGGPRGQRPGGGLGLAASGRDVLQGEAVPGQHRQVVHALDGRLDVEQRALRRRPADQLGG
ncbi:hypothetical protein, partial [Streptomyces sp. NPDC001348]